MTIRSMIFGLLLALSLAGCKPEERPARTAVINTRDVVTKCNEGMRASEEIQRQFADRRSELRLQEEAIRKLQSDPALSDPKSGKQAELQRLSRAFLEANQQLHKDVAAEESVRFQPVVDKVNKVLAAYARDHGLLSVQDKNGFAYIDPSLDITEEIIRRLDQAR